MPSPHKLLILYTGGTIGMQQSAAGLVPAGGFEARLRAEQQAHPERPVPHWLFRELSPLLDSANMTQRHWLAMRTAIIEAVEEEGCDAVLLLHGTDTLAYSAAALSFLLLGLEIPVLLTGSMQPAGVAGSDAWPNLFGALAAIQGGLSPGVRCSSTVSCCMAHGSARARAKPSMPSARPSAHAMASAWRHCPPASTIASRATR